MLIIEKNIYPMRPYRKRDIASIFLQNFENIKFFNSRLEFSLSDYEQRQISIRSLQTIQNSIWITTMEILTIITFIICIIWPNNDYTISIRLLERIIKMERIDLIMINLVFAFGLVHCFWLYSFKQATTYQCSLIDCCLANSSCTVNDRFCPEFRSYLINFYAITNMVAIIIIRTIIFAHLILLIINIYAYIHFYQLNILSLIQLIISLPLYSITVIYIAYIMSEICMNTNFLIFTMVFIELRLKQLFEMTKTMLEDDHRNMNPFKIRNILYWKKFQMQYVQLYAETARLNRTTSVHFVFNEFISKSAIITGAVFYSQQTLMNSENTFVTIVSISIFCFINGLYSRASRLPSYNQRCVRSIFVWIARSQFNKSIPNYYLKRIILRHLIKLNLFITTMTNNRFGFTCGRLFFITKFRYINLFILNFHLMIKFYKKICMK